MNSTVRNFALPLLAASACLSALAEPVDLRERVEELKSLRWGMFICWSLSTFSGKEWTPGVANASYFRTTGCDTEQWARTARESGMGYILFLAKHHDGFCLWDTATTDRKVTKSPLGRDVLADLRTSCEAHGVKLALYFSEGDWTWPGAKDGQSKGSGTDAAKERAQLTELLTRYGPIEYLWVDHAAGTGGLSHAEFLDLCRSLQPRCLVGFNHGDQAGAPIRIGELGHPGPLTDHTAGGPYMPAASNANYRIAEFTYPILPPHTGGAQWFYSLPQHDGLCLPAEKLFRDYLGAVQYGNLFSIDVGPDYAGRLREIDVKTLRQVGERIRASRVAPDLDARFASAKGWLGADGIYSVALPGNRTAWLFSDTWTGVLQDGKRTQARMINNSVGVTEGSDPAQFYYPTDQNGQAASLFAPPDGRGWYWLWAGVPDGERLGLFAARVKKTDGGGAFGFDLFGTALGEVANPQDAPTAWRVRWQDMPESWKPRVFWGSAALAHDGFVYVYGFSENGGKGLDFQRHMLLARTPSGKLADFAAWRFYGKGAWHAKPEQAEPLCPGVATEYSVTYLPARKRFLLVTHDLFLSPNIVALTAEHPWGPWSDKTLVYTCPEASAQRGVFCYAAKHQPAFSDDRTLAISYAANANDMSTVLNDPSLYVPRFIRIPAADIFK